MDTGKPYLFSSGTSLTIQVFDDLDIHPREVPQAPVMTPQGCYRYSSSHSVIPIPSQDHGESFTECRVQNHTDFASLPHQIGLHFSDPEMMDQNPFFIASFLEACVLFDPGGDVATLPMCDIKNVGVQTADNRLPVSRDSETTTDEEISHICPSLIHFRLVTSPDSDETVLPFDRGPAKLLTASVRSLKLLPFDRGPTSHLPILQAILEISFKMTILFRYSSYRNYLLRYMYINFLGNRPQADGE
jgi:hypothetical protein